MTESVKAYSKYKASDVSWLGQVPYHWNALRAKYLFREVDERSGTGSEELLSVSHKTGVTPRSQKNVTMFLAESNVGHKLCHPGDVVINTMWAWMAALGVSRYTGLVSPSYGVYRPKAAAEPLLPKYTDELLRTELYRAEYVRRSTGVNSSRLRLYPEQFLRVPVLVPPLNEQAGIVKFLAHADLKINRYIRAKKKLITLLNEQKQIITHRAVTRGLNPKVRIKPSGVEWLGDVPEHWETRRIRTCISDKRAGLWGEDPSPATVDEHVICIRVADFDMDRLRVGTSKLTIRAVPLHSSKPRLLIGGDILLEKSGGGDAEPVGRVVLYNLPERAICSNFITRLRPDTSVVNPEWLLLVLGVMQATRRNVPCIKQTTGIQNLDESAYLSLRIAVPRLEEQMTIIEHLRKVEETHRTIASRARLEIERLREYRTRLARSIREAGRMVGQTCGVLRVDGGGFEHLWNALAFDGMGSCGTCRIGHGPRVVIAPVMAPSMAA